MALTYCAERAVSPTTGAVSWVVMDQDFQLHPEGSTFLEGLRGADRSVNTERVYAGRTALFLSHCAEEAVDWKTITLGSMVGFKRWLVDTPLPSRRRDGGGPVRVRTEKSANAVLTTVCEFLRFCLRHDLIEDSVMDRLYEPRYLRFLPAGYDPGEFGQFRTVRSRLLKFNEAQEPFEFLMPDQIPPLVEATCNVRDRFLVSLGAVTGMRIGELLGLHRQDMHLLSDSRVLGCPVAGPHVHARRRRDNTNGALAKARIPRAIPVTTDVVGLYADYTHERARLLPQDDQELVFVNLYRPPLGRGLTYQAAKDMFDRLARATGITVRPHLLRHTAATTWLRNGTPRDVVQHLLGHVSSSSMEPYLHPDQRDQRDAVERGAAWAGSHR